MKDLSKITLYLVIGSIVLIVGAVLFQSSYVRKLYDFQDESEIQEMKVVKKPGRPKKQTEPETEPAEPEPAEPEPAEPEPAEQYQ